MKVKNKTELMAALIVAFDELAEKGSMGSVEIEYEDPLTEQDFREVVAEYKAKYGDKEKCSS